MYRFFYGKVLWFMGGMKFFKEDVDELNMVNCGGYDFVFFFINFVVLL